MSKLILLIYGILLIAGAFIGLKAGSKVSLIMGLVSGAVVLTGVYLIGTNPQLGFMVIASMALILTVTFFIRLMKTHKFMPSGMLLLLSAVALIVCVKEIIKK